MMRHWSCIFRLVALLGCLVVAEGLAGCSKPQYDSSTPQAALDSMYKMIADGHPEMLGTMIHIEPRDRAYADGVTEASAIAEVTGKAGQMLGQLYRVAGKLRDRYPDQALKEVASAQARIAKGPRKPGEPRGRPEDDLDFVGRFLADPFGLMDQNRSRVSVEDLGDGTAAVLIDGKPVLGLGLQMKDVNGAWKVNIPIELLQKYRPDTREEWTVLAKMMLSIENALTAFETELDRGDFRDLAEASNRAGRLLGERMVVQGLIYQVMKENSGRTPLNPATPKPAATAPAAK